MRVRSALLGFLVLLPPSAHGAHTCPEPLATARRLVLVTMPTMASPAATMRGFERANVKASWQLTSPAEPAVLGRRGAGWGAGFRDLAREGEPIKREGDLRTPAGIYALGPSFGFAAASLPG